MEQIRAYTDMVIKYLLGTEDSKEELKDFINAVLEDSGFEPVEVLEIKNPFSFKEFEDDKLVVLDIKVEDDNGRIFDIEIQVLGNHKYVNRSLYYWSKVYNAQIESGDRYSLLKPVECINIINFNLFEEIDKFHTCFLMKEKDEPDKILTDHIMLHFIELPKLEGDFMQNRLQEWTQYFRNEGKENKIMQTLLEKPVFSNLNKKFKQFTSDERARDIYEGRMKRISDEKTNIEVAREEGLKEAAKNLLKLGSDINFIHKATGLSVQEIEKLK